MKRATFYLYFMILLSVMGCRWSPPRADMTEAYPRHPFARHHRHPPLLSAGPFAMPPGEQPVLSTSFPSIQHPVKGSGVNGPPRRFPPLTDTEVTYGH